MPTRYGIHSTKSFLWTPAPPIIRSAILTEWIVQALGQVYPARLSGNTAVSKERLMSNPVVLITGALTGIGRATALAFAHEGARVVVSGRNDEAGHALVTEICALGAEAEV